MKKTISIDTTKNQSHQPWLEEDEKKNQGAVAASPHPLPVSRYVEQVANVWPSEGRHILAHYNNDTIVVYQAYRESIARYALEHQQFGGDDWQWSRMSWIKPNFLWMMYRSDWGRSKGQEAVLGIRIRCSFFDALLEQAVESSYSPPETKGKSRSAEISKTRARPKGVGRLGNKKALTHEEWKEALAKSNVRLQWDPDHEPSGAKCNRRAIQLGLRGPVLEAFGTSEIVEIIDMSDFIAHQRTNTTTDRLDHLETPTERVYVPAQHEIATRVGLSPFDM
jgi:Domain of unknown function (DUF4291)